MNLLVVSQSGLICWLITVTSENSSSRKLRNQNWFAQPLVHTVMGRNSCPTGTHPDITVWTRGQENPVPGFQLPGKDTVPTRPTSILVASRIHILKVPRSNLGGSMKFLFLFVFQYSMTKSYFSYMQCIGCYHDELLELTNCKYPYE